MRLIDFSKSTRVNSPHIWLTRVSGDCFIVPFNTGIVRDIVDCRAWAIVKIYFIVITMKYIYYIHSQYSETPNSYYCYCNYNNIWTTFQHLCKIFKTGWPSSKFRSAPHTNTSLSSLKLDMDKSNSLLHSRTLRLVLHLLLKCLIHVITIDVFLLTSLCIAHTHHLPIRYSPWKHLYPLHNFNQRSMGQFHQWFHLQVQR